METMDFGDRIGKNLRWKEPLQKKISEAIAFMPEIGRRLRNSYTDFMGVQFRKYLDDIDFKSSDNLKILVAKQHSFSYKQNARRIDWIDSVEVYYCGRIGGIISMDGQGFKTRQIHDVVDWTREEKQWEEMPIKIT